MPETPDLSRLAAAEAAADEAQKAMEEAKAASKLAREAWEEAVADLRREAKYATEPGLFGDGPKPWQEEG